MIENKKKTIMDLHILFRDSLKHLYNKFEIDDIENIILKKYFGYNIIEAINNGKKVVDFITEEKIVNAIIRLKEKTPVQHKLKWTIFRGLKLKTHENVFTPRAETEDLVGKIIWDYIAKSSFNMSNKLKILDIGTGNGCIAISLKKYFVNSVVVGIDKSSEAISIATVNARTHKADVSFYNLDLYMKESLDRFDKFDVIVCNPPRVMAFELELPKFKQYLNEPKDSICIKGDNQLDFYEEVIKKTKNILNPGAHIYFEVNDSNYDSVFELLEEKGFSNVKINNDSFEKKRIVSAEYIVKQNYY